MNGAARMPANRDSDDFYATPRSAIDQLLDVETFDGPIWEPACGDGAISRVLQERGYRTIDSDLVDRGFGLARQDFLFWGASQAPNIVTNPPFKLATDFVRHALSFDPLKVAMLLKIGFLEGPTKADLHAKLARVWVIRRRVTFLKGGKEHVRSQGKGGIHTYAWFIWEAGHVGSATIGWLEGEPCK